MSVHKWRIQREWCGEEGFVWVVMAPGFMWKPMLVGNSFRHCVNALPYLQRIDRNWQRLGGRR